MAKTKRLEQLFKEKMLRTNKAKHNPIINKLKYAIRHSNLWRTKTITDKKKENKKRAGHISANITE